MAKTILNYSLHERKHWTNDASGLLLSVGRERNNARESATWSSTWL